MKKLWIAAVALSTALTACSDDSGTTTSVAPNPDPDSAISDESSSSITNGTSSSTAKTEESSSSRIADINSSSSTPEIPATFSNKSIIKDGEVVDLRNGKTYKTTTIGKQVWMAENLALDVAELVENGTYQNDAGFFDALLDAATSDYSISFAGINAISPEHKEHFYPWVIAIDGAGVYSEDAIGCGLDSTCSLQGQKRGICPKGFHIPDSLEVEQLFRALGGKCKAGAKLKAQKNGWKINDGTDEYGFSALPVGYFIVGIGDGYGCFTYDYTTDPAANFLTKEFTTSWGIKTESSFASGKRENIDRAFISDEIPTGMSSVRCLRDEPANVDWVDPPAPTAPALPEFEYGELTDPRDGRTYRTVVVNGKTWMDQNLAYSMTDADFEEVYKLVGSRPDINGDFTCKHPFLGNHVDCKYKFKIDSTYCTSHETACKNYGKFYDWYEASVICPAGWRLPDKEEMFDFWNSTNPYVIYTGDCFDRGISFEKLIDKSLSKLLDEDLGKREEFVFWTSTESEYKGYIATTNGNIQKGGIMNVRCVKD